MTAQVDRTAFGAATEPYRRELLAHCYRMLGSVDDAEDVVQETYLRAWRSYAAFEGRSSLRTWLYRIATNACLNALQHSGRRMLPAGLGAPADDPDAPLTPAGPEIAWLQPVPNALVDPESSDPAAIAASRESVRLALVASLQYLPPRQRAVLILRDVLAWPAAEVAKVLDISVPAVKSALQRARARLDEVAPAADDVTEPDAPEARELLDEYMAAFETSDVRRLERLLRRDFAIEMSGTATWFEGILTCVPFFARHALGTPGEWRMLPVVANGQPAAAAYRRDEHGVHRGYGLAVLTTTSSGLSRITVFGEPGLLAKIGLPEVVAV